MKEITTLWQYHQIQKDSKLESADCIIGLGSYDLEVADRCVALYRQELANKILFTGKDGNWTRDVWKLTEAETFANRASKLGVPRTDILLEKYATNIGQNIQFSKKITRLTNNSSEFKGYVSHA